MVLMHVPLVKVYPTWQAVAIQRPALHVSDVAKATLQQLPRVPLWREEGQSMFRRREAKNRTCQFDGSVAKLTQRPAIQLNAKPVLQVLAPHWPSTHFAPEPFSHWTREREREGQRRALRRPISRPKSSAMRTHGSGAAIPSVATVVHTVRRTRVSWNPDLKPSPPRPHSEL